MVSKWISQALIAAVLLPGLRVAGAAQNTETQATEDQPTASKSPARSRAEIIAAGYLRTLWAAQQDYKKRNDHYATSLAALVGHGSFTKRLANTNRRDYTVHFHSDGSTYSAELVPKQFDSEHPAFFMDESGVVRSEPEKQASADSAPIQKGRP